ncbi:UTP--glucose-1-phosphate uridylyltransferase GalU [Salsipaludibacter albus]|uniref:UTP--glucose-1-phosphate uridylyltransferase GalU n=1 Tax=Salsipaludibacter albus TaxID=2849650 RepID=UPI001EE479FF|nr:UTP--glucose-1-phosphate uridylyltransferase GalU [Salsipaludibacter albus]MBY5161999.1 UTP--glucose-1-phosphate uridylyltransferase GalU [Salsipaludibacter albus]
MTVRKAVIPAAGYGTRFLPATKAVPKELLPIVDRPTIEYIVDECARAGLDDVLLVTSAGKSAIEDHFDRALELEAALEAKGKDDLLSTVRDLADLARVHAVRQGEQLGLGHAVLQARHHVGDESFAVLLGDDIVDPDDDLLERMIAAHDATGRAVVALMQVDEADVDKYGIASVGEPDDDGRLPVTGLVEKPDPADAPSDLAVIGRYVLPSGIFDVLDRTGRGAGGEIQLTDALETLAADEPIVGIQLDGIRHDAGDKFGFLAATIDFALRRDDLGPQLADHLRDLVATRLS